MGNRVKEILLLCLAVLTLVVAVYTFRSKPAAGSGTEQAQAQAATLISTPRPAPPQRPVKKTGVVLPNSTRDPFVSPAGASPNATPQPAAVPPAPVATPPLPTPVVTTPTPSPTPGTPPLGVATTPSPPAGPTLSGVIADPSGTPRAVIRVGEKRYLVQPGDKVGGTYRVASVSGRQVVLAGTGGKLILKMGGSQ